MALYHDDIVDIDLDCGTVHRSFAHRTLGKGDVNANRYGVRLWRSGQPVNAEGAQCIGYFIRYGHGDTVTIDGGLFSGQEVYVTLKDACYAYDGAFSLTIKLIGGGVTGTMRIVGGTVDNGVIGPPVDPGGVIPDLDELLAVIGRAEAAANTIAGISIRAELVSGDNYRVVVSKS